MVTHNIKSLARLLGGKVAGRDKVLCPAVRIIRAKIDRCRSR